MGEWGFNISKSELKDVLINTKDNNYIITNPRFVLELTEQVSKMKKLYKIEPNNFPPKETTTKYLNLMIRAKYTYGGSFWKDGDNGMMIDSNGYYWGISKEFLEVIDESVKDAQMLN